MINIKALQNWFSCLTRKENKMNRACLKHKVLAGRIRPRLNYHNNFHAGKVRDTASKICKEQSVLDKKHRIFLAATYQDIIYVPGANDNEEKSARFFLEIEPKRTDVAELIRGTTIENHISGVVSFENNPYLAILLDADLWVLAEANWYFLFAQKKILKEHKLDESSLHLNVKFFQKLISKGFIFRTPYMKLTHEQQARDNLEWFIKTYG